MSNGIHTQTADELLTEVDEFYFGYSSWYFGTEHKGDRLKITLSDPDADDESTTKDYLVSATQLKNAFTEAKKRGYYLCCERDIVEEGIGFGCAQDLGIIVQTACYGELVFG